MKIIKIALLVALFLSVTSALISTKWRVDHPTPTSEDLKERSRLSKARVMIIADQYGRKFEIPMSEFDDFIANFTLTDIDSESSGLRGTGNWVYLTFAPDVFPPQFSDSISCGNAQMSFDRFRGTANYGVVTNRCVFRMLHPSSAHRLKAVLDRHPEEMKNLNWMP